MLITYTILASDGETALATACSQREAEIIARRLLGVRRPVRSAPSPLSTGDDGWRHASADEGCASVRIIPA